MIAAIASQVGPDLSGLLPSIQAPTLIIGHETQVHVDPAAARRAAALIPNARLLILEGIQSAPGLPDRVDEHARLIEEFVGIETASPDAIRPASGTAIILFTDIADSTALTERLGDARFREASRALDTDLRTAIREAGGAAIEGKLLGDGVLRRLGRRRRRSTARAAASRSARRLSSDCTSASTRVM